jgi:hypothetical protein
MVMIVERSEKENVNDGDDNINDNYNDNGDA